MQDRKRRLELLESVRSMPRRVNRTLSVLDIQGQWREENSKQVWTRDRNESKSGLASPNFFPPDLATFLETCTSICVLKHSGILVNYAVK